MIDETTSLCACDTCTGSDCTCGLPGSVCGNGMRLQPDVRLWR